MIYQVRVLSSNHSRSELMLHANLVLQFRDLVPISQISRSLLNTKLSKNILFINIAVSQFRGGVANSWGKDGIVDSSLGIS